MNGTYTLPQDWLLKPIQIALIGCGGTGSEMFDELYRMHSLLLAVGGEGLEVVAFDPDTVSPSNIGRQRFWPADIGYNKAEVLVNRVNNFGGTDWTAVEDTFSVEDYPRFDILITCVDTPELRAEIGTMKIMPQSDTVLWLDMGNDSHSGNVILGHVASQDDELRLPNVFDLYPVLASMKGAQEPSCSTAEALNRQDYGINRSVAREGANLIWQLLRHGEINHHGSYIDIRTGVVSPLAIDEAIWASFRVA